MHQEYYFCIIRIRNINLTKLKFRYAVAMCLNICCLTSMSECVIIALFSIVVQVSHATIYLLC